jgi:hypothetical protein
MEALSPYQRLIHAKMDAEIALVGIDKPEQDQRAQVAGVARAKRKKPEPPPRQSRHAGEIGSGARLGGEAREKRRQFSPREARRRPQDEVADGEPERQSATGHGRRKG